MENESLFSNLSIEVPLAQKSRPKNLDDLMGQTHFLNDRFRKLLESDKWSGFVFWGPPGTGKTSLAWLIARITRRPFHTLSGVTSGVKDIREVLERSKQSFMTGLPAHILFIDEVHRLNKAQQDVLLPYLESGAVRFIGATTENPSFEINNAIASRCAIFKFNPLTQEELLKILAKAAPASGIVPEEILKKIAAVSVGDARRALTLLEALTLAHGGETPITDEEFEAFSAGQSLYYDKHSEYHYDTISAFIKSMRGSDPDGAVYYLARMLEAGEDPVFVARRLVIFASEDVGNANPAALMLANSALQAVHAIGMPEARIILSQAATYLACSEKSNRSYVAIGKAMDTVKRTGQLQIPMHLRNAPTKMMKEWGYGKNYQYPHDDPRGWVKETYLPKEIENMRFYEPSHVGNEKKYSEFLKSRGKGIIEKETEDHSRPNS